VATGAIALAFVLAVLFLVTRTGGTLVGDSTTHVTGTELLPQMVAGDEVVQQVVASGDRLAAVQITFGTYLGAADCTLRVSLRADDGVPAEATGPTLATADWDCAELADSAPVDVLTFAPVEDSAGSTYDLLVERVDERESPGVVLWAGEPRGTGQIAGVNGEATELSAVVRPLYDPQPTWWDQLDVITARMAAFGPSWGTAGAFAALLVSLAAIVAAVPLLRRRPRAFLALVILLALVRGLLWASAVPTFGGMDEPAHFSNVQFMAEERALPGQGDDVGTYSDQVNVAHDQLNLVAKTPGDRPDYSARGRVATQAAIEAASAGGGGGGPAAAYPPPYYVPAALLYPLGGDSFFDQVMAARMWSVLLGVLGAVIITLTGRRLFPGRPAVHAAFAVAGVLHPMASHQFAIVNNDAWVMVAGFASLLVALELARRGRAPGLALLAGALIGAALLGKPFGAAVAVPLVVGWLIGKVNHRIVSLRVLAGEAGLVVLGFAATYGLWRGVALLVGIPAQRVPVGPDTARSVRAFLKAQFDGARLMWGDQLWGNFGWVRIPFPEPIPTAIYLGMVLLVVGAAVWAVLAIVALVGRRRSGAADEVPDRPGRAIALASTAASPPASAAGADGAVDELGIEARLLVTVSMLAAIVLTLYAAAWVYYASTGQNDLLQGRYALLALPAILALPGLLAERFGRGRLTALPVTVAMAVAMAGLTLLGLKRVLESFYG